MIVYCHDGGVLGEGPTPSDVMLIGIAPGRDEWTKTKRPFTGPSGKINDGLLKLIGLTRQDVYVSNLLCWWKDEPTEEDIMRCLPRLLKEIEAVKPKVIVCLGKIVTEFLMQDAIPKDKKFGSVQGGAFFSETFNCWMLSTYHPAAYIKRGGSVAADIAEGVRDYRKIPLYLKAPVNFGEVSYHIADSLDECNTVFDHFISHDQEDVIALDIETYYDGSGMMSMAFACSHGVFHIPKSIVYGPDYKKLLSVTARWTFHNGMFDTQKINEYLGIKLPIMEDTLLMSYSLDERGGGDAETDATGQERAVGIHGLKTLAMEYCGAGFYGAEAKGQIDQLSNEKLALYNSSDAAYTYRLQRYFEPLQIADNVRDMYLELLVPAANSLRDANERGVYIDQEVIKELAQEWIPEWLEKQEQLQEDAKSLGWPLEEINTNSPKQLSKFIYDMLEAPQVGTGKLARSTSRPIVEELIRLYPDHPATIWLKLLIEWRGLERDLNVWIKGIDEHLDANSFIHPEPLIHGTRNGRTSYHLVPVQTLPKARTVGESRARIRKMIHVSPPSKAGTGPRILLEADMRQAELWIAAFESKDDQMLIDLQSGDFHARVAEATWGKSKEMCTPVEWEYRRDSAKRVTYGVLYNAGPDALITEKKLSGAGGSNYLFIETRQQAQDVIEAFNLRYDEYAEWREVQKRTVMTEGEQVSHTGRKRRYYMVQDYRQLNQAVNTPIASFSHDFIFATLIEIPPYLAEFDAWYLFEVHDSIVYDIPKKYLRECVDIIEHTMTKPRWDTPLGVPIDMKVGENWYDMISLDKYLEKEAVNV